MIRTETFRSIIARLRDLRFGSLSVRIAVIYGGVFAVVLALVLMIAGGGLSRFGEASATRDMQANARVFEEILDLRAGQMNQSAEVLARDFGFREAVATGDGETIASALDSLKSRSGTDAAFVLTLDGDVLSSGESGLSDPTSLWYSLDAGKSRGIVETKGKMALAAASPILAPDLIGWLVIAQPLDRAELDRLVELAPIQLEADVKRASRQPEWIADHPIGDVFERSGDQRLLYHVSNLPVLQDGIEPQLVLSHSLSSSLASLRSLQWLLAGLAIFGIWIAVVLSWRVARSVTGPLKKLDAATRAIGEGRDVQLKIETDDEIGRLAESFNTMVNAIEEREREIIHVGLHDGLTGLPNRKLFTEQLLSALARRRANEKILVAYDAVGAQFRNRLCQLFARLAALKRKIYTKPRFLEQRYGSGVKNLMSVFWVALYTAVNLTTVLWLGGLAGQSLTGWGIIYCMMALAGFAALYSLYGGLKAVALTDIIQVVILIIGGLAITWFALDALPADGALGGFSYLMQEMPGHFEMILEPEHPAYGDLPGIWTLLGGLWVLHFSYWGFNQCIIQRALGAENLGEAQKGLAFAAFLKILVPFIVVVPGIAAVILAQQGILDGTALAEKSDRTLW